jgi:hypothetical protein
MTLACRLGRHQWVRRVEQGESYTVCAVCGKPPSRTRSSIRRGSGGLDADLTPAEKANR